MTSPLLPFDGPTLAQEPPLRPPQPNPVRDEIVRLNAACGRVLAYLELHGSATNVELSVPEIGGLAAVRRVWDLTQRGHVIEKTHEHGGVWRYTLKKTP